MNDLIKQGQKQDPSCRFNEINSLVVEWNESYPGSGNHAWFSCVNYSGGGCVSRRLPTKDRAVSWLIEKLSSDVKQYFGESDDTTTEKS